MPNLEVIPPSVAASTKMILGKTTVTDVCVPILLSEGGKFATLWAESKLTRTFVCVRDGVHNVLWHSPCFGENFVPYFTV